MSVNERCEKWAKLFTTLLFTPIECESVSNHRLIWLMETVDWIHVVIVYYVIVLRPWDRKVFLLLCPVAFVLNFQQSHICWLQLDFHMEKTTKVHHLEDSLLLLQKIFYTSIGFILLSENDECLQYFPPSFPILSDRMTRLQNCVDLATSDTCEDTDWKLSNTHLFSVYIYSFDWCNKCDCRCSGTC